MGGGAFAGLIGICSCFSVVLLAADWPASSVATGEIWPFCAASDARFAFFRRCSVALSRASSASSSLFWEEMASCLKLISHVVHLMGQAKVLLLEADGQREQALISVEDAVERSTKIGGRRPGCDVRYLNVVAVILQNIRQLPRALGPLVLRHGGRSGEEPARSCSGYCRRCLDAVDVVLDVSRVVYRFNIN